MPPPELGATPALPPETAGQMGAGGSPKPPFAGVTSMMGKQQEGGASPTGALKSGLDAIKKVVENLAKMSKAGAPFASRISQMCDAWQAEEAKSGSPGGASTADPKQMSARPPEDGAAASFVG